MQAWIVSLVIGIVVKYLRKSDGMSLKLPKSKMRVVLMTEKDYVDFIDATRD